MSDERKLSTDVKENKTTETFDNEAPDAIGTITRSLAGSNLITSHTTIVNEMSSSQSPEYSIPGSPPDTAIESKVDDMRTSSTMLPQAMTLSIRRQPSEDGPRFDTMLADNEWDRDDDEEDSDDDSDDDDLPQVLPGGMPLGGFMAMGSEGDDDDLPTMTPGLIRQNGYYRSETSHDFMAEQRAA